jgi:hypothetical protein
MGIQLNAKGVDIIFAVQEDGAALDISTATGLKLFVKGPSDSAAVEKTATFVDDGSDGQIKYRTTSTSDTANDEAGEWKIQASFVLGAFEGRSSIEEYQVSANL